MNKTQEALKMAIEQIKWAEHLHDWHDGLLDALQACKEALEQPAQKSYEQSWYDTHAASSWQGLSKDRIRDIGDNFLENNNGLFNWIYFASAIEQELKQKNFK